MLMLKVWTSAVTRCRLAASLLVMCWNSCSVFSPPPARHSAVNTVLYEMIEGLGASPSPFSRIFSQFSAFSGSNAGPLREKVFITAL